MKELVGNYNLFNIADNSEGICITTNGIVKRNGCAVLGAGLAKTANTLLNIDRKLGIYLTKYGNRVFNLGRYNINDRTFNVISFPTKHDWRDNSDINLIRTSCVQLVQLCDKFNITKCYLPPVGCGLGKLDYNKQVKPLLSNILDDRFVVVLRNIF